MESTVKSKCNETTLKKKGGGNSLKAKRVAFEWGIRVAPRVALKTILEEKESRGGGFQREESSC